MVITLQMAWNAQILIKYSLAKCIVECRKSYLLTELRLRNDWNWPLGFEYDMYNL